MKKLFITLTIAVSFLLSPIMTFALPAGDDSVIITQHRDKVRDTHGKLLTDAEVRRLKFTIIDDSGQAEDTTKKISASDLNFIRGWYFYAVEAYINPEAGSTAPDLASIFVVDDHGLDFLGSEDGSTTAYAGLDMIHASLKRTCLPNLYLPRAGLHVNYYPQIHDYLSLKIIDQTALSADFIVELTFTR